MWIGGGVGGVVRVACFVVWWKASESRRKVLEEVGGEGGEETKRLISIRNK